MGMAALHPYRSVLRHPVARRLFWSQALSSLGDWVGLAGLVVLAYRVSGSTLGSGGLLAVQGAAAILGGTVLGGWLDRLDRSRALSGVYAVAGAALVLPLVHPRMWTVLLAAGLVGLLRPVASALRYAITADKVPEDLLGPVVAAQKAAGDVSVAVGLSVGGAAAVALGPHASVLADVATFLVAAAICTGLPRGRGEVEGGAGPLIGLRLIADTPRLRWFLGAIALLATVSALPEVLAPAVAGDSLWLAAVLAGQAAGTAAGGLVLGTRRDLERAAPLMAGVAATVGSLVLGAMAVAAHPALLAVANLALGFALSVGVLGQTAFTRAAPRGRTGAVVAAGITLSMVAEGLGSLLVGAAATRLTPSAGYTAAAAATAIGLGLLWAARGQADTVVIGDDAPSAIRSGAAPREPAGAGAPRFVTVPAPPPALVRG